MKPNFEKMDAGKDKKLGIKEGSKKDTKLDTGAAAGAKAHFAKMKLQAQQLRGAGATTGGLATAAKKVM